MQPLNQKLNPVTETRTLEEEAPSFLSKLLADVIEATQQRDQLNKTVTATATVERVVDAEPVRRVKKPRKQAKAQKKAAQKKAPAAKNPVVRWKIGMVIAVTYQGTATIEGGTHMSTITDVDADTHTLTVDFTYYDGSQDRNIKLEMLDSKQGWDVRDSVACTVAKANDAQRADFEKAVKKATRMAAQKRRVCKVCGDPKCKVGPFEERNTQ